MLLPCNIRPTYILVLLSSLSSGTRIYLRSGVNAFFERGSTFPLQAFLKYGVPSPAIVGMRILFRKIAFLMLGPWDYPSHFFFSFSEVRFRVRCGTPQVWSLGSFRANLYRRTPRSHSRIYSPYCTAALRGLHVHGARRLLPFLPPSTRYALKHMNSFFLLFSRKALWFELRNPALRTHKSTIGSCDDRRGDPLRSTRQLVS